MCSSCEEHNYDNIHGNVVPSQGRHVRKRSKGACGDERYLRHFSWTVVQCMPTVPIRRKIVSPEPVGSRAPSTHLLDPARLDQIRPEGCDGVSFGYRRHALADEIGRGIQHAG